MNTRQVVTGTLLTASLLFGGAGLADAAPSSRPAMDRGTINCDDLLDRVEGLQHIIDHLEARRARLAAELADAQADGSVRRVHRLEHQIAQADRVIEMFQHVLDRLTDAYNDNCAFQGT